jgi:geranylgeranyl diphosphate synthase, type I
MEDLFLFQRDFQPYFDSYLDERIAAVDERLSSYIVTEAINQARRVAAGGKRIRPYVCMLSYQSFGGTDTTRAFDLGVAIELFHAFALTHDDIIDRGLRRHGQPTVQTYLGELMRGRPDAPHIADGQAMLVGDLLLGWAYRAIERFANPELVRLFHEMADRTLVGEMLDVDLVGLTDPSLEAIESKTLLKTAYYSFVYPASLGACLAGRNGRGICEGIGIPLGRAFQYQDDLLDIFSHTLDKTAHNEVINGQHTLMSWYVMHRAPARFARELVRIRRGWFVTAARVRSLFTDSGSEMFIRAEIARMYDAAETALGKASFSELYTKKWTHLISVLRERTV